MALDLFGNSGLNNAANDAAPRTSLNLKKGMSLDLAKHANLKRVRVGLGWQAGDGRDNYDLDASALLLNSRGLVTDNQDVIFYNQQNTGRGVRSMGDNKTGSYSNVGDTDDETIMVDINQVPQVIDKIKFIVTIHDAVRRKQNFGAVRQAYIRIVDEDTGEELGRYQLTEDFDMQTACEIAELNRTPYGWEFTAIGKGTTEDLESILIRHGVN